MTPKQAIEGIAAVMIGVDQMCEVARDESCNLQKFRRARELEVGR